MSDWVVRRLQNGVKLESDAHHISLRINGVGYWCSFRQGEQFYRRCLDGWVVIGHGIKALSGIAADTLHRQIQAIFGALEIDLPLLKIAGSYGVEEYRTLRRLYLKTYPEDVPILPPDRYGDVVVQPAVGCPNRACTFCAFYLDNPFKVLSEDALLEHLRGLKALFGDFPDGRDGVFIGSANAMALSQRRLLKALDLIESELGTFRRGIAAFSDPDFSARRTDEKWQLLASKGLRHLVIGLETGYGPLRGRLGKSAGLEKVRGAVQEYQTAGISTGLTVLTGICTGEELFRHHGETLRFIEGLSLDKKDLVYLSPYESADSNQVAALEEQSALKEKLREVTNARIVPYQMSRFRYYS